jgi:hypothetical protein
MAIQLSTVQSFGSTDAEADSLLQECFQSHSAYVDAIKHQRFLILGRKGTGKTAIFKKIIQTRDSTFFSFGHTFLDYPWEHHRLQGLIGVPEELRFTQSWVYLILMTTAKVLLNQDNSQPWSDGMVDDLDRLEKFVVDSYGTRDPDVTQLFSPSKRLKIRPHIKLAKDWLDAGVDLEKLPVSDLPKVVREVNQNITAAVINSLNPDHHYYVCFDELDHGFNPKEPLYVNMLIGLILAAKSLNDAARRDGKQFSVIVFLRDDIYELLRFEDKNKITENAASTIEWDSARTTWTLKHLMERRFQAVIPGVGERSWDIVFDEEKTMSGRQKKYQHMLDRTFRRPRDMIKFCNEVLAAHKTSGEMENRFCNADVIAARDNYSRYFLHEIEDEIPKHLPDYERHLDLLRTIGVAAFDRESADEAFRRRFGQGDDGLNCADMLKSLFQFSILAFQKTGGAGGGSEFVWRYNDPGARYDDSAKFFRCHPGLIESLGLKQWAKSMESDE